MGGIGTFFKGVNDINKYPPIEIKGSPASPIDTIFSAIALLKQKNVITFFPGYIPPLFSLTSYVITIHDLNHLDRKENTSLIKRIYYKFIIKRGCYKASFIFTVSEFSKKRIVDWSGVDENKVINVGNAVSSHYSPTGEKLSFGYEFLLCVSNRKKHKNEIRTIEAFKNANIDKNIRLVFTGKPDDNILESIEKLDMKDRIVFTGYLKDEDLPKLKH